MAKGEGGIKMKIWLHGEKNWKKKGPTNSEKKRNKGVNHNGEKICLSGGVGMMDLSFTYP